MKLKGTLLFIGDSITESGRWEDAEGIGNGYVRVIHDYLAHRDPEIFLNILNKGVGGDRITDLAARWEKDVLQYNPTVVSISIGINDVWRQLDSPEKKAVLPDEFIHLYADLLKQLKDKTGASIILMEPTILQEDLYSEGNRKLKPYVEGVKMLAEKFDAVLVPTHEAFCNYLQYENRKIMTTDGVHMNSIGNMLMAKTWLKAVLTE
ncbi:SGNH/GDSL hydrolase family protein [Niallia nealsonii]|uniref:Hydrolase n=1 Tax=Niallia nealsonii TaxID=115979 RepID=A0A2N0Z500_9BACI|nr:SGNH/GDSL hydrolase family protein [Niallia nealsonii]PKG24592.1 hydrolase [Niallia nealsonii]